MSSFKPFKILLVGAAGVGKIDFVEKISKKRIGANYKLTVGVDILTKDVEFRQGEIATLSIWDIGGQQRFEFIRSTFYKGAAGALLVFDLTREQTYILVRKWLTEIRQFAGVQVPFLLIGNTVNLTETKKPAIDSSEVREFAEKEGGIYLEASPDMTLIVEEVLRKLTRKIVDKRMSTV